MGRRVFLISVASSLLASVAFAWFLEPITKWIWFHTSESAASWFVALQNAAFENAALGKRDWLSTAVFLKIFMFWILAFGATPIAMAIGIPIGRAMRRSRAVHTRRDRVVRVLRAVIILLLVILAGLMTYDFGRLAFAAYVDLQLNASFSQRLDALSPYIEPLEERRLRSAWALMKTRPDYERINHRIDELAKAVPINIPEPLLK